ncbi:hypothetical protein PGB90_006224 [Kerria lacca]
MDTGLEKRNGSIYNISLPFDLFNKSDVQTLELLEKLLQFTEYTNDNLDNFFFIINGVLVLFMQIGFACLEAGSVRYKNVGNIMLKNFLDSLICSIVFWLTGYAIAFGDGNAYIGWTWFAGINIPNNLWSEWFFQYTFASTAGTILSGAVAERCSFITYLSYSLFMSGFIYPVIVHWTWSYQGWLKQLGFIDYAGGMLIHGVAGTACLVAAKLIGPRIGRFDKNSEDSFSGHSNALIGIGSIIILVGFCGFNAGTLNHYSKPRDGIIATIIIRNTIMCGAGGALTTLFLSKFGAFNEKYWYFEFTVNGGLAGLVS